MDRPSLADEYQARHEALCVGLQHHWDDHDGGLTRGAWATFNVLPSSPVRDIPSPD